MTKREDETIRRLSDEIGGITGLAPLGYLSCPTPTTPRYVFQDGMVCLSASEALAYVANLRAVAHQGPFYCADCPRTFATAAERDAHRARQRSRTHGE
jgi:hypothetical protein